MMQKSPPKMEAIMGIKNLKGEKERNNKKAS